MDRLLELLGQLTEWVDTLVGLVTDSPLTYLVIFALASVDAFFPVVPAETIVTAAAVLAGQGQLSIGWVMLAAGIGAFVGDNIAYWIGRGAGRPLLQRVLRDRFDRLEVVERQFARRGGVFIIIGRFVPGGRTLITVSAGVVHFSWPRFVLFDAIAAVIWALQASIPGYIGGSLIQDRPWLAMVIGFALSASVALGITVLQHRWERNHPDVAAEPASEAQQPPAAEAADAQKSDIAGSDE